MFCFQCGTKIPDGAIFCPKCGAKQADAKQVNEKQVDAKQVDAKPLSVEKTEAPYEMETPPVAQKTPEEIPENPEMQVSASEDTFSASEKPASIIDSLKENINMCPAIKSAKRKKEKVYLRSKHYLHTVRLTTVLQAQMRSILVFPFSLLYILLIGAFCAILGVCLQELIKYGSICIEYYHFILFSVYCLTMGAVLLMHSCLGRGEKTAVKSYVSDILAPEQIYLPEKKWSGAFKQRTGAAIILLLAGIIILPFSIPALMQDSDELLFHGLPAVRFMEMTQEDIESEFEILTTGRNYVTGDEYYNYYNNSNHKWGPQKVIYSKETGKVIFAEFRPEDCSYRRRSLDKTVDRVLDLISFPYNYIHNFYSIYGTPLGGFYYHDGVHLSDNILVDPDVYIAQREFEKNYGSAVYQCIPVFTDEVYTYERIEDRDVALYKAHEGIFLITRSGWLESVCFYSDEWIRMSDENEEYNESDRLTDGSNTGEAQAAEPPKPSAAAPVSGTEYKAAYAEKVRELAFEDSSTQFALIDLLGNGIPQLVADQSYMVSVFTWADGELVTLIDQWGYDAGYDYLPGENIIYGFDSDYAGAITYEYYMRVNDRYAVESVYDQELSIRYITDTNGDGWIDEGDAYSDDPAYYYGDTQISEETYESYQIDGWYEQITGDLYADEILAQLDGSSISGSSPSAADATGYPDENGNAEGRLGDTMHTYFFDYTVNSAYLCDEYEGYTPAYGNEILVADVTIRNTSTSTIPMYDTDFQIQWNDTADDAFGFPVTFDLNDVLNDWMLPGEYNLSIGESTNGLLVYEVPAGNRDFSISYLEMFDDDSTGDVFFVYFSAGKQ